MRKIRVLVVGQTPPPYYGQAIMIEKLVRAKFDLIEIIHLRMSFSATPGEIGKFRWKKVFHLVSLLFRGIYLLVFRKIDVLYYPPAGPQLVPIIRDMLLLCCWQILARRVIYHFRAGGISEYLDSHSSVLKLCARFAYGKPAAAIVLSRLNPKDAEFFGADQIFMIPNGMEDVFCEKDISRDSNEVRLFYIGLLIEEKGIHTLLDAFRLVSAEYQNVSLHLAGEFQSLTAQKEFLARADEYGVRNRITLYGLVTMQAKWELFAKMDVMCFLSYYPAETFGNSVLEAMIWELPVVATMWRGVQDLVVDQETGFLVPIRNPQAAADKLKLLLSDSQLRVRLGKEGRARFIQNFSLEKHLKGMETAILSTFYAS